MNQAPLILSLRCVLYTHFFPPWLYTITVLLLGDIGGNWKYDRARLNQSYLACSILLCILIGMVDTSLLSSGITVSWPARQNLKLNFRMVLQNPEGLASLELNFKLKHFFSKWGVMADGCYLCFQSKQIKNNTGQFIEHSYHVSS